MAVNVLREQVQLVSWQLKLIESGKHDQKRTKTRKNKTRPLKILWRNTINHMI